MTERIYSNGASSLDVRTCEQCGEAAYADGEGIRRCASCESWAHPCCAESDGGGFDDDGEFRCCEDCIPKSRAEICADMGIASDSDRTNPRSL